MTPDEDPGPAPAWARLAAIGAVAFALGTIAWNAWGTR